MAEKNIFSFKFLKGAGEKLNLDSREIFFMSVVLSSHYMQVHSATKQFTVNYNTVIHFKDEQKDSSVFNDKVKFKKSTVVNQAYASSHGCSLEITPTVHLTDLHKI